MKVAVIGAGNVGAMVAGRIVDSGLADVILLDIVPGLAKGKALDISDARPVFSSTAEIAGSEDINDIRGVDVVVITAGLARKPGMSRSDLLARNAVVLKGISSSIKKHCISPIIIVVTNPLDVMTYLVMKTTGFDHRRVIGMAGVLDTARFINIASGVLSSLEGDNVFMMGSHGDSMVAIDRSKKLSGEDLKEFSDRTRGRGAEIVSYLKSGSAYFAPSAAVFYMLKSILKDEKKEMCCSVYLDGEYGEKDVYIGVPVVLGAAGVEGIVETGLTPEEKAAFKRSAQGIRSVIDSLKIS